ncbi:MAG: NfeD family protein [Chloroflexota bacterium]
MRGRVVKDLDPVGTVYVNKELWRARSPVHLTRDTPIMVIGQQGLELQVEKAKNEDVPIYDEYVQEDIKYQSKEN